MSDIDLTEAIEAAHRIEVTSASNSRITTYSNVCSCGVDLPWPRSERDDAHRIHLIATTVAQVRAQVAAEIEIEAEAAATKRDNHRRIALEREAGSPGRDSHMKTAHAWREQADAFWRAAHIARGDA